MSVIFLLGRSYADKEEKMYAMIRGLIQQKKQCLLIVPEQYSLEAEKQSLIQDCSFPYFDVHSFVRFAFAVFLESGNIQQKVLTESQKIIFLKKIVLEHFHQFRYYGSSVKKIGFLAELNNSLKEFSQHGIGHEKIDAIDCEDEVLKAKLHDLSLIMKAYQQCLQKEWMSSDEVLDVLVSNIEKMTGMQKRQVFFHKFDGFTAQEYSVIEQLLLKDNDLYFVLDMEREPGDYPFGETKKTYEKLRKMALDHQKSMQLHDIQTEQQKNEELTFLEEYLYQFPYRKYPKKPEKIEYFEAANKEEEVEYVAGQIIHLVKNKHYRWKEIVVMVRNLQEYEKYFREIFSAYQICYFLDQKEKLSKHPLAQLILSVLSCIQFDFSYEAVFCLLKCGLYPIEKEVCDELENYVLAKGIRSYRYQKKWEKDAKEKYDLETLELTRVELLDNLEELMKESSKDASIKTWNDRILHVLDKMHVKTQMEERISYLESQHDINRSQKEILIWNQLSTIIESLNETIPKHMVSLPQYHDILEAVFENTEISQAPSYVDAITCADMERSRPPKAKVLFLAGCTENLIPFVKEKEGMLNENEKKLLEEQQLSVALDNNSILENEEFYLYKALTHPSEMLFLSRFCADFSGKSFRPAYFLKKISAMFPKLTIKRQQDIKEMFFLTDISLKRHLSDLTEEERNYVEKMNNDAFANDDLYQISEKTLMKLYKGKFVTSISQIEQYNRCPFAYFMQYILRASKREVYEMKGPDVGILFHMLLDDIGKKLNDSCRLFKDVTEEEANVFVDEFAVHVTKSFRNEIFTSTNSYAYSIEKLKRVGKRALSALIYQDKKGEVENFFSEMDFGGNFPPLQIEFKDGNHIYIHGKIDRVDIFVRKNQRYIKIIDYKSSPMTLDFLSLYYGLQLQLLLYMEAALHAFPESLAAGMFYFTIQDPLLKYEQIKNKNIQLEILKSMKLEGLIVHDHDIIKGIDNELSSHSDVLKIRMKKDGQFAKSAQLISADHLQVLMQHARLTTKNAVEQIVQGNLAPKPLAMKQFSSCDYCDFQAICKWEKNKTMLKEWTEEEIWELLKNKQAIT